MKIKCDQCKKKNKGNYSSFIYEEKILTLCKDCRWGSVKVDKDKKLLEHISTPFWLHMGQKPNPQEKAQLNYMKSHNLTWTDLRKIEQKKAQSNGAFERFQNRGKEERAKFKVGSSA